MIPNSYNKSTPCRDPRLRRGVAPVQGVACKVMDYDKLFTCDAPAGILYWKPRPEHEFATRKSCRTWNTRFAKKPAGHVRPNGGYVLVRLGRSLLRAHRIIWEMTNGPIPNGIHIDHINGCTWDNRICNLRMATRSQNLCNSKIPVNNKTGHKGVCMAGNRYIAQLQCGGIKVFSKGFDNIEDAIRARKEAEQIYQGQYARAK